ncbi:MAG: serine O-acetyltransferase [Parvibaculales bacterium]
MSDKEPEISQDEVWQQLCEAAAEISAREPLLADYMHIKILEKNSLTESVAATLSDKLANTHIPAPELEAIILDAFGADANIAQAMCEDIVAVFDRDPACKSYLDPVLFFKGFLALQTYRAAHVLLAKGHRGTALYLQNTASEVFGADIHPAAKIGKGIMIDHATSVVIGETAVIGDEVSMLHGVTLGGSGKEGGDRHPKIGNGVLISVGAKVLGNIRIGDCAKIGGGSVVLTDVPAYSTAVGVPAKVVGKVDTPTPSRSMDHSFESILDKDKPENET